MSGLRETKQFPRPSREAKEFLCLLHRANNLQTK